LLVEPQRTNLLTYSSSFSSWLDAGGSVTSNTTTAPDGTTTADTLTGARYQTGLGTNVFTFSCYAKKLNGDNKFVLRFDVPSLVFAQFDLNTGTIDSVSSGYSATITEAQNGWYRCTFTSGSSISISNAVIVSASGGGNSTYVWGAQIEVGSYPTSYIPTTSASVTRNADQVFKTGISSLIGQTEGTMFVDVDLTHSNETGGNEYLMQLYQDAGVRIILYRTSSNELSYYYLKGLTVFFYVSSVTTNQRHKLAFGYKNGDSAFYIDGVQIDTDTSALTSFSSLSELHLGANFNPTQAEIGCYPYNAAAIWKTRLTNTQLAQLTTI
jgi:hypothetical protein